MNNQILPEPLQEIAPFIWPIEQLGEALLLLTRISGYLQQDNSDNLNLTATPWPGNGYHNGHNGHNSYNNNGGQVQFNKQSIADYIELVSNELGIETEPVNTLYPHIEQLIRQGSPALFQLDGTNFSNNQPHFLLLVSFNWGKAKIVSPTGQPRRCSLTMLQTVLGYALEKPLEADIDDFLKAMNTPPENWPKATQSLYLERLQNQYIAPCWFVRPVPTAKMWPRMRQAKVHTYFLGGLLTQLIDTLLDIGIVVVVGQSALFGRVEWVWIIAAALMIITKVPFSLLKNWLFNLFSLSLGTVIKQRLFYGILQLNSDEVQLKGAGEFLAWTIEAEKLEELIMRIVTFGFRAFVTIPVLAVLLALGAGGIWHTLFLLGWCVFGLFLSWQNYKTYYAQHQNYNHLTNNLLEKIVGHQTRQVQETPETWHLDEDQALSHHLDLSDKNDRSSNILNIIIPYGWPIIGILGIIYPFLNNPNPLALGASFLAILMIRQYIEAFGISLVDFGGLVTSWLFIKPILEASTNFEEKGQTISNFEPALPGQLILNARNVHFRYATRDEPVLSNCNLNVYAGDRLLLEGPSGGGKSTLASLLINLHQPETGLILLRGFDQHTIKPSQWRQHIVAAPQFHENHIIYSSFAFNLLMGRRWPALPEDLVEAETICRELGLGNVLDRMPLGLQQIVGDGGWRLSHGERSRVYIARALLQNADLIILDESFASLDPESMETALKCVLQRANTLMVIAHP